MPAIHLLKVSRLEGLSDGIFAIAMTIMVLNLHVPADVHARDILPLIKHDIFVNLLIYIGSFTILGTHWIAMNFQIGLLERLNRPYLWSNMIYLMVICVIPFSANLLGEYPESLDSIYFYIFNLLCASAGQLLVLHTAQHYHLNKPIYTQEIYRATLSRIFLAPIFYVAALFVASFSITLAFFLIVSPTLMYIFPGKIDKYESHNTNIES